MTDLSGYEKDQIRKKLGRNRLSGYELDVARKEKKENMAKKMPSREREILEKAHIKSFGKPMPKHLKKDYPNIK